MIVVESKPMKNRKNDDDEVLDVDDNKNEKMIGSYNIQLSFIGIIDYRYGRKYYYDYIVVSGLLLLTFIYNIIRIISSKYLINGIIFPYPDSIYCQQKPYNTSSLLLSYLPLSFLWSSPSTTSAYSLDDPCQRTDLFAFQLTSGIAILLCGYIGFMTWHYNQKCHNSTIIQQTPIGRLFSVSSTNNYLIEYEYITIINFIFQLWDFIISLYIPEHCTTIMLCHHIAASTVCYISLRYQVLPYYSIYFLGCVEISSISLVFIDLFKYYPLLNNDNFILYDIFLNHIAGPSFVLLFIYYRVIKWWPMSYQLYNDIYNVTITKPNIFKSYRPKCSILILYIFLILNIPLGILQLYWLTIIINEVRKQFM